MKSARQPPATTPCLICGYDLTGLEGREICPECAMPAGPSERRNLFEISGSGHGRRVLRGLRLARDAAWGGLIALVVAMAGVWINQRPLQLASIGLVVAAPMFAFGWWLATAPPRRSSRPVALLGVVKWVRLAVLAVPITFIAMMVALAGHVPVATGMSGVLFPVLYVALLVAMVTRVILTSEWIGRFSTHLGDDRTPKQVRRGVRLAPILVVLFILLLSGAALLHDLTSEGSILSFVAIGASMTTMAAAFGIYAWLYIGLIHTCHRTVRTALAAAENAELG